MNSSPLKLPPPRHFPDVSIYASGTWQPSQVITRDVASTQVIPEHVHQEINREWDQAISRAGRLLFDGPMSRFEGLDVSDHQFTLFLSTTSYRPFYVLHMVRRDLLGEGPFGGVVAAQPIGVSCLIISQDNDVLLGRRGERVAYYPSRIHPFAGSLEPADGGNLFATLYRELEEELALKPEDIAAPRLIGLISDRTLRQPEVILCCQTHLTTADVRARVDPSEHDALVAVPNRPADIQKLLNTETALTPVCRGSLILLGENA